MGGPGFRLIVPPQAAHHGGMWRRAATPDRHHMPDNQGRPPPRRPGRAYAAAPGRTHHASAEAPPPGETDGRSAASAAAAQVNKIFCFVGAGRATCATAHHPGWATKRLILLICQWRRRRRAAQSIPRGLGGRGPRSSAGSGGRSMGGYYDTPPWVLCALCNWILFEKNSSWWQTWRVFLYMSVKKLQKSRFWVLHPPPHR